MTVKSEVTSGGRLHNVLSVAEFCAAAARDGEVLHELEVLTRLLAQNKCTKKIKKMLDSRRVASRVLELWRGTVQGAEWSLPQ